MSTGNGFYFGRFRSGAGWVIASVIARGEQYGELVHALSASGWLSRRARGSFQPSVRSHRYFRWSHCWSAYSADLGRREVTSYVLSKKLLQLEMSNVSIGCYLLMKDPLGDRRTLLSLPFICSPRPLPEAISNFDTEPRSQACPLRGEQYATRARWSLR